MDHVDDEKYTYYCMQIYRVSKHYFSEISRTLFNFESDVKSISKLLFPYDVQLENCSVVIIIHVVKFEFLTAN